MLPLHRMYRNLLFTITRTLAIILAELNLSLNARTCVYITTVLQHKQRFVVLYNFIKKYTFLSSFSSFLSFFACSYFFFISLFLFTCLSLCPASVCSPAFLSFIYLFAYSFNSSLPYKVSIIWQTGGSSVTAIFSDNVFYFLNVVHVLGFFFQKALSDSAINM